LRPAPYTATRADGTLSDRWASRITCFPVLPAVAFCLLSHCSPLSTNFQNLASGRFVGDFFGPLLALFGARPILFCFCRHEQPTRQSPNGTIRIFKWGQSGRKGASTPLTGTGRITGQHPPLRVLAPLGAKGTSPDLKGDHSIQQRTYGETAT
jgi:hypothetical protein